MSLVPRSRCFPVVCLVLLLSGGPLWAFDSPGRYQMSTTAHGMIVVFDTISGQCWSKVPGGKWVDEGNPFVPPVVQQAAKPVSLALPTEPLELAIKQRQSKIIPGSSERIRISIDDITAQQVLVSIHDREGNTILDDVSLNEAEIVGFKVNDKQFFVRIKELKNVLFGTDFATLELVSDKSKFPPIVKEEVDDPEQEAPKEQLVPADL